MEVSHHLIASFAHLAGDVAEHTSYPAVRRQADSATLSHRQVQPTVLPVVSRPANVRMPVPSAVGSFPGRCGQY